MRMPDPRMMKGPRGRRLLLELAAALDPAVAAAVMSLGYELDPGKGLSRVTSIVGLGQDDHEGTGAAAWTTDELAIAIRRLDLTRISGKLVASALHRAVDFARYWQEPDGEDRLAELPGIAAALEPVARAVLTVSATSDWGRGVAPDQWRVHWKGSPDGPTIPDQPRLSLATWSREARKTEAHAQRSRPRDPRANLSGEWWSLPVDAVRSTVGRIPEGLDLVEDSDWDHAVVVPVRCSGRILEIATAEEWRDLCRRFPLVVTASRWHDWYFTTGRAGDWVIPDWSLVAKHWDAVHLPITSYLENAGRIIEVDGGAASLIAGWNPDATIWLADSRVVTAGRSQIWHRRDDGWEQMS